MVPRSQERGQLNDKMTHPGAQITQCSQTAEEAFEFDTYSAKELPAHLVYKAERELNENVLERAKELEAFREAVQSQHDLKSRTDDNFLLRFLRTKKYDRERALALLRNYYKQRKYYPELYESVSLSPELAERAERELNEFKEELNSSIQALREEVQKVTGLKARTDDAFLVRFLRARKFDQERSLQLLKNYYKQRLKYPELYKNLSAASIENVLESNVMGMLPHKDDEGKHIFVYNSSESWDPEKVPVEDAIRYCLLSLERVADEPDFQVLGVVSIADCKGFSMKHLRCFTPSKMAQFFSVTQNSFPARFKEFHFVNEPPIFDFFYALVKPFISKKLKSRLFFHGSSMSSLHEHFSPEILPLEFGGTLGPFNSGYWNKKLLDNDDAVRKNFVYGFESKSVIPA